MTRFGDRCEKNKKRDKEKNEHRLSAEGTTCKRNIIEREHER